MTKEISPKHSDNMQNFLLESSPHDSSAPELLFPQLPESSYILVGTGREDFLASRMAIAVEDADANLINMNLTALTDPDNSHIVELRIDHRDPERVARSLERYGYNILNLRSNDSTLPADDIQARIDELIHYIYM